MITAQILATRLAALAMRDHTYCEDSWYSCPKSEGGCADESQGIACNCGANQHNWKVAEMLAQLLEAIV